MKGDEMEFKTLADFLAKSGNRSSGYQTNDGPPMDKIMHLLNQTDFNIDDVPDLSVSYSFRTDAENVILIVAYTLIIIVSLFGNCLVCRVVFKNAHNVTYIFIANLAVSDLLMTTLNIPFNLARNLLDTWPFGGFMCHFVNFTLVTSVYVSTFTMLAICVDRYRVILNPFKSRMSCKGAVVALILIWIFAASFALPYAIFYDLSILVTTRRMIRCKLVMEPHQRDVLTVVTFTTQYAIPMMLTSAAYARISWFLTFAPIPGQPTNEQQLEQQYTRRRTIKMLIVVVVVFILCWMPLNLYHVIFAMYPNPQVLFKPNSRYYFLFHWLAMSSVCYNPFIYCYLNEKFRAETRKLFHACRNMSHKMSLGSLHDGSVARTEIMPMHQFVTLGSSAGLTTTVITSVEDYNNHLDCTHPIIPTESILCKQENVEKSEFTKNGANEKALSSVIEATSPSWCKTRCEDQNSLTSSAEANCVAKMLNSETSEEAHKPQDNFEMDRI